MANSGDLQQRLVELETRVAFQEQTLQEMSDALAHQQKQMERLQLMLRETQERLRGITPPVADRSEETPPPHY